MEQGHLNSNVVVDGENTCRICGNGKNNEPYRVKELHLGLRDEFDYFECSTCGCLQIKNFPENIDKYYPSDYYSYNSSIYEKNSLVESARWLAVRSLIKARIGNNKALSRLSTKFYTYNSWLIKGLCDFDSSILDIGCGNGSLLRRLQRIGFRNLTGADPYIKEDIRYDSNLTIYKKQIDEVAGKFDLVMLHHSFEHMPNPAEVMKKACDLLRDGGCLLIRIPVTGTYAWRKYKENWAQIDAPRHFFLHTTKSIAMLAEGANLTVEKVIFDSTPFQFIGSEKYLKDVSLKDKTSVSFSKAELKSFAEMAKRLNRENDGDSACFYLRKKEYK
ncbi:class I SAM-dependent methyltransferase [Paludibacter sp. 221]|uniref:class I SAM-dependent methyltransferase n=1 Tax=Paludibacter sp. 221 TaxID=2302939 RepID=UPI0013D1FDA2|nr:class I SAM-dependent methyltransferase [Paludibacter sp. 221]NDV47165.1 class I SAM-dependent methyltransferase [Paludibacter sp. 221]